MKLMLARSTETELASPSALRTEDGSGFTAGPQGDLSEWYTADFSELLHVCQEGK